MYWHLLTPLAVCTVGVIMLAFTLADHPLLAFFALTLSATSQASNPLEWGCVSSSASWLWTSHGMWQRLQGAFESMPARATV